MLPVAVLQKVDLIHLFPEHVLAALICSGCAFISSFNWRRHSKGTGITLRRLLLLSRPFRGVLLPCFQFSEPGHGATSDSVAHGK